MVSVVSDSVMQECRLCPRGCGVNRSSGQTGFCGAGAEMKIYRYGPHFGEEPPVSGTKGSGTVFFSHCTLKCIYCQNYSWSQEGEGALYTTEQLAEILVELADAGCHNWNMVSPTCWLPYIGDAVEMAHDAGYHLPIVYNSSGFECLESLNYVAEWVNVFLVDLRYSRKNTATDGSNAGNYVNIARKAILKMYDLVGNLVTDDAGIAQSGIICRLLILPGKAEEVVDNLYWLAENIGNDVSISVMEQYLPTYKAVTDKRYADWNRRISRSEYELVCEVVEKLGFSNGWMQDFAGESDAELLGFNMQSGSGINK